MGFIDHYAVLGLPSGGDHGGFRLSEKDITKAYKAKALILHPDKRRNDPAAHSEFQKLRESYQILKDVKARELFDNLLLSRQRRRSVLLNSNHRQSENTDAKRRRMMADLEERERRCYSVHHRDNDEFVRREEENRIAQKLKQEVAKIRMMATASNKAKAKAAAAAAEAKPLDRARVLKVSWQINSNPSPNAASCGYTADRLRQLCGRFGEVEDVLVSKKRCSALVVMADKDSAVAASWSVLGDVSNPLLVQPLDSTPPPPPAADIDPANHSKFEELVLAKLKQAVDRQKGTKEMVGVLKLQYMMDISELVE